MTDSPLELPDPKLNTYNHENDNVTTKEDNEALKAEIKSLRKQLNEVQSKVTESSADNYIQHQRLNSKGTECLYSETENEVILLSDEKIDVKSSTVVPVHKTSSLSNNSSYSPAPVAKMAERVKLRRTSEEEKLVTSTDLLDTGLSTAVAEHLVGDILQQCDKSEKQPLEVEINRLSAQLEHSKAQNAVLALTLTETKEHCDR